MALTNMRHILLDCGEATMFQLVRLVGPEQASEIVAALDVVWLSHTHADHILGVFEVARAFFRITGTPLKVFAPKKLHIPLHILYPPKRVPAIEEDEDGGVTISEGSTRKPGDWKCPICRYLVFGCRNLKECPNCKTPISDGGGCGAMIDGTSSSAFAPNAAPDGGEVGPVPWLTFLSSLESVPMQVTSCSDLETGRTSSASASVSAASICEHLPRSCELIGLEAARVEHRFEGIKFCATCELMSFQLP